jgi:hypothetical protein
MKTTGDNLTGGRIMKFKKSTRMLAPAFLLAGTMLASAPAFAHETPVDPQAAKIAEIVDQVSKVLGDVMELEGEAAVAKLAEMRQFPIHNTTSKEIHSAVFKGVIKLAEHKTPEIRRKAPLFMTMVATRYPSCAGRSLSVLNSLINDADETVRERAQAGSKFLSEEYGAGNKLLPVSGCVLEGPVPSLKAK